MCGIYGHLKEQGEANSVDICLNGLKKLEYRGYDSAGIAGISDGKIISYKNVGKVEVLDRELKTHRLELGLAIAHTRWATHGCLTTTNAHPHYDHTHSIALVHNGVIENYQKIRTKLMSKGIRCISETDTEVISQLISYYYKGDLLLATQKALKELEGTFAIALIHKDHPGVIITAVRSCPLIIGLCSETKDVFLSSDINAFPDRPLDLFYLHDEEIAVLTRKTVNIYNQHGEKLVKQTEKLGADSGVVSKEGYKHFLLKEIYEQPLAIRRAIMERIDEKKGSVHFEELTISDYELKKVKQILILACGSSYHSGYLSSLYFQYHAKIPTQVEIASEFCYRDPIISDDTLVIAISQSGETADTLAAVKKAKALGAPIIAICNVKRTAIPRIATCTLWQHAGPEISVCSTKAFTSQLAILMLLNLKLARLRGMAREEVTYFLQRLKLIPELIPEVLKLSPQIEKCAQKYSFFHHFFFVGRQHMFPTCLESTLKLKEISYIYAHAYPAGELKHGPIALISPQVATIAFAGNQKTIGKLQSNLMEIKARGGPILAFAPHDSEEIRAICDDFIPLPSNIPDEYAPFLYSVAGQLFAYHTANTLGTDIDQPRNLAKSVTVE